MAGKQNEYYKNLEKQICNEYKAGIDSLRDVADKLGTNHKMVGRALRKNNIEIVKAPNKPMSDVTKRKIGDKSKGRIAWNKSKKMPRESIYKNMATHLRFNIDYMWLMQFDNLDKLKLLNKALTRDRDMPNLDIVFYKKFINKFYKDKRFNLIYDKWLDNGMQKLLRPSLDHIIPKSRGGTNELKNLQYLTWLENFSKRDMLQDEWDAVKSKIGEYFVR